jgi:ribosomal protein S18 acetylase RimI-like enzyme
MCRSHRKRDPKGRELSDFRLVSLERGHIRRVVDVHMRAFPGFFLTSLGAGFLKGFYGSFLDEKTAISLVAVDAKNDDVLGGVFGTDSPAGFFGRLATRRWLAFGFASAASFLRRPWIIGRLVRGLAYRGDPPGLPGYALLSSIAVAPEAQGRGVGKALLEAWVAEAKNRVCRGAYLTTDSIGNEAVNGFYRKAGWTLEGSFVTPEGRRMNRYVVNFGGGKP